MKTPLVPVAAEATAVAGRARGYLSMTRLGAQERWVLVGAALLALSLFAPWYGTEAGNAASAVNGLTGDVSAWSAHEYLRWGFLFVLAHAAALIWNALRGHDVPWLRGEPTMIQAINGLGLVAWCGFIDRPGEPMSTISLNYGWWLALVGILLMIVVTGRHAQSQVTRRLPPGVLR